MEQPKDPQYSLKRIPIFRIRLNRNKSKDNIVLEEGLNFTKRQF